jgi:hypothetical protein
MISITSIFPWRTPEEDPARGSFLPMNFKPYLMSARTSFTVKNAKTSFTRVSTI